MHSAVRSRPRTITLVLAVVLVFGFTAALEGQAQAKPTPPTVTSTDASAALNGGGMCVHTASFLVEGVRGKWASYEAQRSFDGGLTWRTVPSERVDIRSNPVITVEQGFSGETMLRLRLVKRATPLTGWATADSTSCA